MRWALVLAVLLLAGCAQPAPSGPPADAPEWSFTSTQGETFTRDAPARNATILFFMATWCSSCRVKAPVVAEVANESAARGALTLSVGFDPTETPADLAAWQERYHQGWPHGVDVGQRVQRALGVTSQSSVVVLDAKGRVVESWGYGLVTAPALRAAVDRALSA